MLISSQWSTRFISLVILTSTLQVSAYAGKPDPWNADNNPAVMNENYIYELNQLPMSSMLASERAPWSDNYWQSNRGGISFRWNGANASVNDKNKSVYFSYVPPTKEELLRMSPQEIAKLSPAEKLDIMHGRYDYPTVQAERIRTNPDFENWEGLCHGWIQAAIHHPEPQTNTVVNPDGIAIPFAVSDVKGLITHYYGVKMYDYARGKRWVSRLNDKIQYLDSIDTMDGSTWKDLPADLVPEFKGYLADAAWCETDQFLRDRYIPETWVLKSGNENLKAQLESCGSDLRCKSQFSTSLIASNKEAMTSQCMLDQQKYLIVYPENLVKQIGLRVKSNGLVKNIFKGREGIKDVNPGAFHVVVTNQIGLMKEAFGANIILNTFGNKVTQVWNQPVTGYAVRFLDREYEGVTDATRTGVRFKKSVDVETDIFYVSEIYQHMNPVVGMYGTNREGQRVPLNLIKKKTVKYRLDLDENGRIIGGEWDKRKDHPNFLWTHKALDFRGYYKILNDIYKPRWDVPSTNIAESH